MSGIVHAFTSATTAERRNADEALGRAIRELRDRAVRENVWVEIYPRSCCVILTSRLLQIIESDPTLLEALDRAADRLAREAWS